MRYRKLGNDASWFPRSREEAIACVHRALDLGVTLLAIANAYGRGRRSGGAEALVGDDL